MDIDVESKQYNDIYARKIMKADVRRLRSGCVELGQDIRWMMQQ